MRTRATVPPVEVHPAQLPDGIRGHTRDIVRLVAIAVGLFLLYVLVPLSFTRQWFGLTVGLVAIVAVAPFAVKRAMAVSNSDRPVLAAVEAVVVLVSMIVFGFSILYLAINRHGDQFEGLRTKVDAVYFTVATISTVGYGDVHAVGRAARAAVTVQILFDLTLVATSIRLIMNAARNPSS